MSNSEEVKLPLASSLQQVVGALLFGADHPLSVEEIRGCLKSGQQVKKADITQRLPGIGLVFLKYGFIAAEREGLALQGLQFQQPVGSILEFLVFDELAHQIEPRIDPLLVGRLIGGARLDRQQHPALDHHQRGGHDQKLAGDVEIQHAHDVEIRHVLRRDPLDRDVVDIDLLAPDQIEQQIERPFKHLQIHLVVVGQQCVKRHTVTLFL